MSITAYIYKDLLIIAPEIVMCISAIISQIGVIIAPKNSKCSINVFYILTLATICITATLLTNNFGYAFNHTYVMNEHTSIAKILILILLSCVIVMHIGYGKSSNAAQYYFNGRSEYITLLMLATVGIFIAISARDLMILFVGLELQALSCYILASFNSKSAKSSEAGLKYFILGAFSSCVMLFGMSIIYGINGDLSYDRIATTLLSQDMVAFICICIIFIGMLFKLSVAPFHIWTQDVYEGSPAISVAFFSSVLKLGTFIAFVNLLLLLDTTSQVNLVILLRICAVLSMIIGSLGAIMQKSLKRIIAYSTILNMGYALVPIIGLRDENAIKISIIYILIYSISTFGIISALTIAIGSKIDDATLEDIVGLGKTRRFVAVIVSVFMFSMIGIPPLAGFFGKYYIIIHALRSAEYFVALSILLASVISACYYLNIVRYMYFYDKNIPITKNSVSTSLRLTLTASLIFVISLSIFIEKILCILPF